MMLIRPRYFKTFVYVGLRHRFPARAVRKQCGLGGSVFRGRAFQIVHKGILGDTAEDVSALNSSRKPTELFVFSFLLEMKTASMKKYKMGYNVLRSFCVEYLLP